jgi:hypothetical protein
LHRFVAPLLAALLVICSACAQRVSFVLSSEAAATVYYLNTAKSQRTLLPTSDAHRKLREWIAANQDGWEKYLATPPAQGIIVRAQELNLQFIGNTVLVHSRQGVFSKHITQDEYLFLSSENGT